MATARSGAAFEAEREALQREGGDGGVAAAEAGDEEGVRERAGCQAGEKADGEAAADVDRERAPGEGVAEAGSDAVGEQEAGGTAEKAAEKHEKGGGEAQVRIR